MSDFSGKDGDPDKEPYWSLADTLAWVATRNLGAIARIRKSENSPATALAVWQSINGSSSPVMNLEDAWEPLSQAMCDGLRAFATRRQRQAVTGIERSEPGALFPPADAPGSPLNYRVEIQNQKVALAPTDRAVLHSWQEWTDFRFKREMVQEIFRPLQGAVPTADLKAVSEQIGPEEAPTDIVGATVGGGKKPGTKTAMAKTISAAQAFLKKENCSSLTKDEAEDLLRDLHSGARELRRKATEKIPSGKRRTHGVLANRDKELEDCRQFLQAAS